MLRCRTKVSAGQEMVVFQYCGWPTGDSYGCASGQCWGRRARGQNCQNTRPAHGWLKGLLTAHYATTSLPNQDEDVTHFARACSWCFEGCEDSYRSCRRLSDIGVHSVRRLTRHDMHTYYCSTFFFALSR